MSNDVLKGIDTSSIVSELISRDGVEYDLLSAGKEICYKPPKDVFFIVVHSDAAPHKKTVADIRDEVKTELMCYLLKQAKNNNAESEKLLVELLKG